MLDDLNKLIKKKAEQKNQKPVESNPTKAVCDAHKESDSEELDWGVSDDEKDDKPVGLNDIQLEIKTDSIDQSSPKVEATQPPKNVEKKEEKDDGSEELDWGLSDDEKPTPMNNVSPKPTSSNDTKKEEKKEEKNVVHCEEESSDENWGLDEEETNSPVGGGVPGLKGLLSFDEPKVSYC